MNVKAKQFMKHIIGAVGANVVRLLISVVLTLIAGLIPSRNAAKKDPVVALRTE